MWLNKIIVFTVIILTASACVDDGFDAPPPYEPDVTPNATIAEVIDKYIAGQAVRIDEELIFDAVVIADDESGNFYKELVVQDETGGIEIQLDQTDLYNDYPIGRRIYVNAEGLYISNFNGVFQLGADPIAGNQVSRLPSTLIDEHIIKGQTGQFVEPTVLTIEGLGPEHISTLVKLNEVQFNLFGKNLPYATFYVDDDGNEIRESENREIESCASDATIILRSSGFASFVNQLTPTKSGMITGVYSVFGNTKQMYIRNLSDVMMNDPRCGGGGTGERIDIGELRDVYNGTTVDAPIDKYIQGVVISDRISGNIAGSNLFLQQPGGAGILVRFTSEHNFDEGTELQVSTEGAILEEYQGLLQLNQVSPGAVTELGQAAQYPVPQEVNISEILADFEEYESELVIIDMIMMTPLNGNNYSGEVLLDDGTGEIIMYTRSEADFASLVVSDTTVTITGIVSQGGTQETRQIVVRDFEDIEGAGTGGGNNDPVGSLNETFENFSDNQDIILPGWDNLAVKGDRTWRAKVFSGNTYAQATAFQDEAPEMETWLITPPLIVEAGSFISFETAQAFYDHEGLSVLISTDYSGDNPQGATWMSLGATIANSSSSEHEWVESGMIDLSSYAGMDVYVAFRYTGSGPSGQTTSYRVDNVVFD